MLLSQHAIRLKLTENSSIETSNSIQDLLTKVSFNSCVICDYDNTLAEPHHSLELFGSDAWFEKLLEHAYQLMPHQHEEARNLVIALNRAIQPHIKMQPVEDNTQFIVNLLQNTNIPVLLVTARGCDILQPTLQQIQNELNLDFSKHWPAGHYQLNIENKTEFPIYYNGQIYCSGNSKDKCIESFFNLINYWPKHITMIDDKENNLISTKKMVIEHGCHFNGLRYNKLDEKVKTIDLKKTTSHLAKIQDKLPMEAKKIIQQLNLMALVENSILTPDSNLDKKPTQEYMIFPPDSIL